MRWTVDDLPRHKRRIACLLDAQILGWRLQHIREIETRRGHITRYSRFVTRGGKVIAPIRHYWVTVER